MYSFLFELSIFISSPGNILRRPIGHSASHAHTLDLGDNELAEVRLPKQGGTGGDGCGNGFQCCRPEPMLAGLVLSPELTMTNHKHCPV